MLSPLPARTKKGDKLLAAGRAAEVRKQYDMALDLFEQALSEDPSDSGYQLAMRRVRFQAGQAHVERGLKLRADGKAAEALAEFEKAYAIDSSSSIAEQEIRRTRAILEREKKQALNPEGVKPEERGLTGAELARKESQERLDRVMSVPELKPLSNKPIDLKMNNQPMKVLFETVGKLAGINVMFDPDIPSGGRNLSVEFNGSTIEEALDYLSTLTKSFWKPLSSNTIFVTQDNTTKRRDYEDQVVKVFYLKNVSSAQELQEIATDVRSICDIRRLFTYNGQMALIVRAEADRVALAEKVIADLDKPKPEVVIDVLVLEHNYDKTRDLAFGLTDGLNSPITYNGTTTTPPADSGSGSGSGSGSTPSTPTNGGIPLNRLSRLSTGQYSVVLPNVQLQATLKNTNTRVLQSPQVRAVDNQKAILKIGNKVPTASGSFQPGIGGVGINPLVNTQFQFLDVGVNVDILPKIHGTDEVSLHVDMDISNVTDHVDLGGISQPVIGQRKVTFDVRMREGEVNILGGLMQAQQSKVVTGWPGLSSVPIIGKLFSRESTDNSVSELLFVLIPHVVRAPEITETNMRGVASGSDTVVRLNYAPKRPPTPAVGAAAPVPTPVTPSPTAPPATAPPMTAPPAPPGPAATTPPATAPPPGVPKPPQAAAPAAQAPTGPPASITFSPARAEEQLGGAITVSMIVDNVKDLFTIPFRVKFDPKIVRLNDVMVGGLLASDGKPVLPPSKNIMNDTGEASITLSRMPGAGGVSGSGALMTFIFQAVGKGTTTLTFTEFALRDSRLTQLPAATQPLTITVK
ncbi:MAG TPA: cohesin domain-containing protein [Bryobacteraceae bacterium]|nr:cohesin domain-containing protein [Bryobacteraceae bacterium]